MEFASLISDAQSALSALFGAEPTTSKILPRPQPPGGPGPQGAPVTPRQAGDLFGHYADGKQAAPRSGPPPSVDDVVGKAQKKLEEGPFTKGPAAMEAVNALKSLPPDKQGEAIDRLAKSGDLGNMLDTMPEDQRHEIEMLTKNTNDPKLKLKLWEVSQKGKASHDIKEKIGKLGTSAEDLEMKATLERTLAAEQREVGEEAAFLRAKAGGFSKEDVVKMMDRKDTELGVEIARGVNLTNQVGVRADGSKIVWEKDEIEAVDRALRLHPAQHHTKMPELERRDRNAAGDNAEHVTATGTIHVFDNGARRGPFGQLGHHKYQDGTVGGTREMADPETVRQGGAQATFLEWTLLHELGHHVHDFHAPGALDKYKDAMEYKELTDSEAGSTLSAGDLAALRANPGQPIMSGNRGYVLRGGKVDSYSPDMFPGNQPPKPGEYFAEHYNQALLQPESTAKEYLDEPQRKAAAASAEVRRLRDTGAPAAAIANAEEAERLANREAATWKKSYDVMRSDVFKTDDAVADAVARMTARGASPEQIARFREQAYRVSTPDQVAKLEAQGPLSP